MLGYDKDLHKELSTFYRKIIGVELEAIKLRPKEDFLECFDNLWKLIFREKELLTEILVWFEKSYLLKKTRVKTIEKLILIELGNHLSNLKEVKNDVVEQILNEITKERRGELINKSRMKNVVDMFIKVDMYKIFIEPQLLIVSEKFYKEESANLISNFELVGFLDQTDRRVREEVIRCKEYLDSSSENKLVEQIEKIFIAENLQTVLSNGFDNLIDTKNHTSLAKLYHFLDKVGKLDFLKKTWAYYIKEHGSTIMNEPELNLEKVLEFKRGLEKILAECFNKNNSLKTAMAYSIEDCVNLKTNKVAELTSKQIDDILKNAHKISQDEKAIEDKLDDVLSIFRFLQARDIFEAFYTKRLVKRVLLGLSSSEDLEKKMIEKLKHECGTTFTRRAEEAMKDFDLSKNLTKDFLASNIFQNCPSNKIEINVSIFSTNSWPLKNNKINELKDELLDLSEAFKKFYTSKFSGVVLSWQYDTSTCEVIGYFGEQKYTIQVSYIQAVILKLFNNQKEFTFQQLKEIINIDYDDLKINLLSFLQAKDKILVKQPENVKEVLDTDIFTVDQNFSSKSKRIKINLLQKKETKEEIDQTTNRVLQERQYLLDAAIVRIMKQKKTLQHNDLVAEIFNDLKLPISIPEIKKRIESLIERDYMTRDKDALQVYHYVA